MATRKKAAHPYAVTLALHDQRLSRIEPVLARIEERLDSIESGLHRQKGFWGAVTLIGGAITAFLTVLKDNLVAFLQR